MFDRYAVQLTFCSLGVCCSLHLQLRGEARMPGLAWAHVLRQCGCGQGTSPTGLGNTAWLRRVDWSHVGHRESACVHPLLGVVGGLYSQIVDGPFTCPTPTITVPVPQPAGEPSYRWCRAPSSLLPAHAVQGAGLCAQGCSRLRPHTLIVGWTVNELPHTGEERGGGS